MGTIFKNGISYGGGSESTDLLVTFSYSGSASADHTFAEIEACITGGGTPIGIYGTGVYTLIGYNAGTSVTFGQPQGGGYINYWRVEAGGSVVYGQTTASTVLPVTISASGWNGNVYLLRNSYITQYCTVTLSMPDQTTEATMEAAIAEYQEYDLYGFNQQVGSIEIYARGTVPTADIQIVMTIDRYR